MRALAGRRILLVEDDEDGRMLLCEGLGLHGAEVQGVESAEEALSLLQTWRPHVLISDQRLPGIDGNALLERARQLPELANLPGIALTGTGGQEHREAAFRAGYGKHLLKPAKLGDLVVAILAVEALRSTNSGEVPKDVRAVLAATNLASPCRFTSLLRFNDDETLASVWTYDRENPTIDPFPLGLPIFASYCVLVRSTGAVCAIENASTDPRTVGHLKRETSSTYLGVPLYRSDGRMFGTVCSYDPRPLVLEPSVRETTERATRELEAIMVSLDDRSVD